MVNVKGLSERIGGQPYAALSLCAFVVAAYLCLVNLDYAGFWHDEAPAVFFGKALLEQGDIVGWDGRNLVGGPNGRALNEALREVSSPLMYILNAVGFAIFGVNEIGARILHALVGILSLVFFYFLLQQHLSKNPRLIFFIFLFASWSAQLLLFFRQSRYYAFSVLTLIAGFYLYECYWRSKKPFYLVAVTLVAALAFFNHYAAGAATMLSLAAWHLLFRARATTRREWIVFAVCGLIVGVLSLAYLAYIGLIGTERDVYATFTSGNFGEYRETMPLFLMRTWICVRDLFSADWISWWMFLWFAGMLFLVLRERNVRPGRDSKRRAKRRRSASKYDDLPVIALGKIVLMGALFALFSALLSAQPVWVHSVLDLRYYVAALPLLLAIKGMFAEWAWCKSKIAGVVAIAVLLFTSAGAAPFNMTMILTGERTLGFHFFQFVQEIHRPYRDSMRVVSDYLLQHAEQDELVYVPFYADRETLTLYVGHRMRFCNVLNQDSPLPSAVVETWGAPLYIGESTPDWIVIFGPVQKEYWEKIKSNYAMVAALDVHPYPTQRPEINFHAFEPLRAQRGVHIMRRIENQ